MHPMFILGRYCVKCCTLGVTLELTTALTGQAVSPMSTSSIAISWREQCGLHVVLYISREQTTAVTGQAVSPMSTSSIAISWREQCGLRVVL